MTGTYTARYFVKTQISLFQFGKDIVYSKYVFRKTKYMYNQKTYILILYTYIYV